MPNICDPKNGECVRCGNAGPFSKNCDNECGCHGSCSPSAEGKDEGWKKKLHRIITEGVPPFRAVRIPEVAEAEELAIRDLFRSELSLTRDKTLDEAIGVVEKYLEWLRKEMEECEKNEWTMLGYDMHSRTIATNHHLAALRELKGKKE